MINFAYMQNLSKKKITTLLYVAGPKTTQKRKGNSKDKKGKDTGLKHSSMTFILKRQRQYNTKGIF